MDEYLLVRIGERVKKIRVDKKLKLHDLAEKSLISKGMLSKIENARSVPSLPVLMGILQALETDPGEFFAEIRLNEPKQFIHIKKSELGPAKANGQEGVFLQNMLSQGLDGFHIQSSIQQLDPGSETSHAIFEGYEYRYLLHGALEWSDEKKQCWLEEGDSLLVDARLPYRIKNPLEKASVTLVFQLRTRTN